MVNWNASETRPTLASSGCLHGGQKGNTPPGGHVWPQCGRRNGLLPPPGPVAELKKDESGLHAVLKDGRSSTLPAKLNTGGPLE